jgi:hypothetical protein
MTIERSQGANEKGGEVQRIGKRLADIRAKLSETVSFPELENGTDDGGAQASASPARSRGLGVLLNDDDNSTPVQAAVALDHFPHSLLPWGNPRIKQSEAG